MTAIIGLAKEPSQGVGTGTTLDPMINYGFTGPVPGTGEAALNPTVNYAAWLAYIYDSGPLPTGEATAVMEPTPEAREADGLFLRYAVPYGPSGGGIAGKIRWSYAVSVPASASIKWVEQVIWIRSIDHARDAEVFLSSANESGIGVTVPYAADRPWECIRTRYYTAPGLSRGWLPSDLAALRGGCFTIDGMGVAYPCVIVEYEEDPMLKPIGPPRLLARALTATEDGDEFVLPVPHGDTVLLLHQMSGQDLDTGGYVSLDVELSGSFGPEDDPGAWDAAVPHHGGGTNVPTGNRGSSYSCYFKVLPGDNTLTFHATDGTHLLAYQVFASV